MKLGLTNKRWQIPVYLLVLFVLTEASFLYKDYRAGRATAATWFAIAVTGLVLGVVIWIGTKPFKPMQS